jgi:hypothetical protein
MKKYYDSIDWGTVLFDIAILGLVAYLKNYWLLIIPMITGGYQKVKEE